MANLAKRIANCSELDGYTDFMAYANARDALAISIDILNGRGLNKMEQAVQAWESFYITLKKSADSHRNLLERLQGWSGSSASSVQNALRAHASWMDGTLQKVNETVLSLKNLCNVYCAARDQVVPVEKIGENYRKTRELKSNNILGPNDQVQILELEEEYIAFRAQNVLQLFNYYLNAIEADKLSEFQDPPLPASMLRAPVKPRRFNPDDVRFLPVTPTCVIS